MSDIAIQFDSVGKLYRLGTVGTGTLSHDLNRWWKTAILRQEDPYLRIGATNDRSKKGESDYVWALKNITFDVQQGDVVGIIGKNGAGKSTLLKLLSRITSPTTGVIRARGRIASLLEVGTGFHPEMTGRENIYMNGSIMGMTRHEISGKLDAIVDFAGIERYLDTPVKRYSSGMTVRLGFAVAAFLEPEILVVDEVLAVGDAEFQKKAIGKMQDVSRGEGRTVLFVSHNMAAVKSLCNRGVVLENGILVFKGSANETIDHYLQSSTLKDDKYIINGIRYKKSGINISRIELNHTEKCYSVVSSGQQTMNVIIEGEISEDMMTDVMLIFKTRNEIPVAALADGHCRGIIERIPKGKFKIERTIKFPKYISTGDYFIDLYLHHPMVEYQLKAPHCAEIHIDGYQENYGRPLRLNEEGFMGLETV
ncbi:ABC transporter ATP-binding protein [uncultured Parabacteroides sp.]|uniref:ABC transporter ATP-binding protein n=1 Tax=uncultured Parabacteroides sp. TaxID=512312 RepID=UPI00261DB74F|nr:ABC transporter ATP-binding protein [uncultured Parabacteroides sp.]